MHWTGLAAETWDVLGGDRSSLDHDFFLDRIADGGEPALDVACGSGRLLLRYLQLGLDVEGVEVSGDMLRICAEKARRLGLSPVLHHQSMEELRLPHRYRTMFIAGGSFGLLDSTAADAALERFREHLEPGGVLAFSLFSPYARGKALSEGDAAWHLLGSADLDDGRQVVHEYRRTAIDMRERLLVEEKRYRIVSAERTVAAETYVMREHWYERADIVGLLEQHGFERIEVKGDFGEEDWTPDHGVMAVSARRAAER